MTHEVPIRVRDRDGHLAENRLDFSGFSRILEGYGEKLSPDIGQCTFVYFSLKKSVGTTWSSISTLGNSLFCEKMGFERESTKFSCFSRILECYGEKTK